MTDFITYTKKKIEDLSVYIVSCGKSYKGKTLKIILCVYKTFDSLTLFFMLETLLVFNFSLKIIRVCTSLSYR